MDKVMKHHIGDLRATFGLEALPEQISNVLDEMRHCRLVGHLALIFA